MFRRPFWWFTMEGVTKNFVSACPVCSQNKTTNKPPSGLLHPLPIASHPWSHIAWDFVTVFPHLMVTLLFSIKSLILFLFQNYYPSERLLVLTSLFITCLGSMASLLTLCQRTSVYLSGIECLLFSSLYWCKSFFLISIPDEQLDWVNQPANGGGAMLCVVKQSLNLECSASLGGILYSHNTLLNFSLGMSTFECCFGYQRPSFPDQEQTRISPGPLMPLPWNLEEGSFCSGACLY